MTEINEKLQNMQLDLPADESEAMAVLAERIDALRELGFSGEALLALQALRNSWHEQKKLLLCLKSTELLLNYLAIDLQKEQYERELEYLLNFANSSLGSDADTEVSGLRDPEGLKTDIIEFVSLQKKNSDSHFEREIMLRNRAISAVLARSLRVLQFSVENFAGANGSYPHTLDDPQFASELPPELEINPYDGQARKIRSRVAASGDLEGMLAEKMSPGEIEYLYLEDLSGYIIRAVCCHSQFAYGCNATAELIKEKILHEQEI